MSIIIYNIAGNFIGTAWLKNNHNRQNFVTSSCLSHKEAFEQLFNLIKQNNK